MFPSASPTRLAIAILLALPLTPAALAGDASAQTSVARTKATTLEGVAVIGTYSDV